VDIFVFFINFGFENMFMLFVKRLGNFRREDGLILGEAGNNCA
jgi:hypothetical protein